MNTWTDTVALAALKKWGVRPMRLNKGYVVHLASGPGPSACGAGESWRSYWLTATEEGRPLGDPDCRRCVSRVVRDVAGLTEPADA